MTRMVVALMIVALGLGATAACGNDAAPQTLPTGTATIDASAAVPTGTACDLLPLDAVTAFMGQPTRVDEGTGSTCVWLADTAGIYQLHLQIYDGHGFYAPGQWGTPEPVPGLGEEAFLVRQATVGIVAGYWDGAHAVFLNYAKLVGPSVAEDKADDLVWLLRTVPERLT